MAAKFGGGNAPKVSAPKAKVSAPKAAPKAAAVARTGPKVDISTASGFNMRSAQGGVGAASTPSPARGLSTGTPHNPLTAGPRTAAVGSPEARNPLQMSSRSVLPSGDEQGVGLASAELRDDSGSVGFRERLASGGPLLPGAFGEKLQKIGQGIQQSQINNPPPEDDDDIDALTLAMQALAATQRNRA